ncbi:MAG: hypothetical protein VZQ80_05975 [Lachnospiraceae bacterium]|nr:hypothetical protein [Lachnospiraceae bacterium]
MLDDIIKKLSDSYTADLLAADEEKEMVTTQLREERKFLKLILSEEGENFNEFSPRSKKDDEGKLAETRKKIDELEKKQEDLALSIELSKQKLSDMKAAREELVALRSELESSNADDSPSVSEQMEPPAETSDENSTDDDLVFHMKNIISYLPADPMRAKVELQNIVDGISKNTSQKLDDKDE